MRTCINCGEEKPETEFYLERGRRRTACKECRDRRRLENYHLERFTREEVQQSVVYIERHEARRQAERERELRLASITPKPYVEPLSFRGLISGYQRRGQ